MGLYKQKYDEHVMMVMMTVTVKMIIMCITKSRIMISVWDDVRCRYQAKKPRDDEDRARRLQTNGPTDRQTNGPTDQRTNGQTNQLIGMQRRI